HCEIKPTQFWDKGNRAHQLAHGYDTAATEYCRHGWDSKRPPGLHPLWLAQVAIAVFVLSLGPLASRIIATALLLVLFFCFVGQTALLLIINARTAASRRFKTSFRQ